MEDHGRSERSSLNITAHDRLMLLQYAEDLFATQDKLRQRIDGLRDLPDGREEKQPSVSQEILECHVRPIVAKYLPVPFLVRPYPKIHQYQPYSEKPSFFLDFSIVSDDLSFFMHSVFMNQ
jgi:hypothetical protein